MSRIRKRTKDFPGGHDEKVMITQASLFARANMLFGVGGRKRGGGHVR